MIIAEIHQNDKLIFSSVYQTPHLSLESVIKNLELYVVSEQLNTVHECYIRARFDNSAFAKPKASELDLSGYDNNTFDKIRGIN